MRMRCIFQNFEFIFVQLLENVILRQLALLNDLNRTWHFRTDMHACSDFAKTPCSKIFLHNIVRRKFGDLFERCLLLESEEVGMRLVTLGQAQTFVAQDHIIALRLHRGVDLVRLFFFRELLVEKICKRAKNLAIIVIKSRNLRETNH